jgi:hypothetical protein
MPDYCSGAGGPAGAPAICLPAVTVSTSAVPTASQLGQHSSWSLMWLIASKPGGDRRDGGDGLRPGPDLVSELRVKPPPALGDDVHLVAIDADGRLVVDEVDREVRSCGDPIGPGVPALGEIR